MTKPTLTDVDIQNRLSHCCWSFSNVMRSCIFGIMIPKPIVFGPILLFLFMIPCSAMPKTSMKSSLLVRSMIPSNDHVTHRNDVVCRLSKGYRSSTKAAFISLVRSLQPCSPTIRLPYCKSAPIYENTGRSNYTIICVRFLLLQQQILSNTHLCFTLA